MTERSEGEMFHIFPQPLPDGKALLFQAWRSGGDGSGSDSEVWSIDLETRERKRLTLGNNPRYAASGHLLFGTPDGTLMAAPFDAARAALTGAAIPIADGLLVTTERSHVVYTVSDDGTLLYMTGEGGSAPFEFVWVTRSGVATPVDAGETFNLSPQNFQGWRLSPDGSRIAFGRRNDGNDDVWIKSLPNGPMSRLTFDVAMDSFPQWTPDGQSITYRNGQLGDGSLRSRRADGTGEPELVFDAVDVKKGVSPEAARFRVFLRPA